MNANLLTTITPILLVLILSKKLTANDYSEFIAMYALVMVLSVGSDLGSRQYFMYENNKSLEGTADSLKTFLAILFSISYAVYVIINDINPYSLFLIALIWRDTLLPLYKFKLDMIVYNRALSISSLFVVLSSISLYLLNDVSLVYTGIFLSQIPVVFCNRVRLKKLEKSNINYFLSRSGSYALAGIIIGVQQNGIKLIIYNSFSPSVLVAFEVVTKTINIGRYFINILVEYAQLIRARVSNISLLFLGLFLQFSAIISIWILRQPIETYFEISVNMFIIHSLIYLPLIYIGYLHKVFAVRKDLTIIVFLSVLTSTALYFLWLFTSKHISTLKLIWAATLYEYLVLGLTLLLIYYRKK